MNTSQIHQEAIVIDLHADTIQRVLDEGCDLLEGAPGWHLDLNLMREGGIDGQYFSIWPDPHEYWGEAATRRAEDLIGAVKSQASKHSKVMALAGSAEEVRRISSEGKLAALMGIEGGHALNDSPELVEHFHREGVKYITLTHSKSTSWAGSSGDPEGADRGLNLLGKEIVERMNQVGMMVDVSHVSDKTFWDVTRTSRRPLIASHSGARALAPHHRNMTDEMIKAVGESGGVVCVVFYPIFLSEGYARDARVVIETLRPEMKKFDEEMDSISAGYAKDRLMAKELRKRMNPMPLSVLADHIEHVARVAGIDHVGIGSDFDGINCVPEGLETGAQLPSLTEELARRGFDEEALMKILGGNVLRVMEAHENLG